MAGLRHLCPTWAALFPSPCPPVSGPNKFALNRAGVPTLVPTTLVPQRQGMSSREESLVCFPAPNTLSGQLCPAQDIPCSHPPETSSPLPPPLGHHCPPHQLPQPLCLHSCPFPDLAQCPRLSQPGTQSWPRPPPLWMHLSKHELAPWANAGVPAPVAPDATGVAR